MKILYELVNWSILTNSSGQISDACGKTGSEKSKVQKENIKVAAQGVLFMNLTVERNKTICSVIP